MLSIFMTVMPVFLIIGTGYIVMWRKLMPESTIDALALFAQKYAIPCLLFLASLHDALPICYSAFTLFTTHLLHIYYMKPHSAINIEAL